MLRVWSFYSDCRLILTVVPVNGMDRSISASLNPREVLVDFVRVYQKKGRPASCDAPPPYTLAFLDFS